MMTIHSPFLVYRVEDDVRDGGVQCGEQAAERVARAVEIKVVGWRQCCK